MGLAARAAAAGTLLASGGGLAREATAAPKPIGPTTSGKLNVWFGIPLEVGPNALVAAFQKLYPNITVNAIRFTNDATGNTKLDTAIQGASGIDVYYSYDVAPLVQRIQAGGALELGSYIRSDSSLQAWVSRTRGIFNYRGKFHALPTSFAPAFVLTNRDAIRSIGLSVPNKWSFDEFARFVQEIAAKKKGMYGIVFPTQFQGDTARIRLGADFYYKKGGKESNLDDPGFRADWQLHHQLIASGASLPWTEVLSRNYVPYAHPAVLQGQAAMWPTAVWGTRYFKDPQQFPHTFVTTFAPEPYASGQSRSYSDTTYGDHISIHPRASDLDIAWAFVQFALGAGARYMLGAGKIPSKPGAVSDNDIVSGVLGSDAEKFFDVDAFKSNVLHRTYNVPVDTIFTAYSQIAQIIKMQEDSYLTGGSDLDTLARTAKQQADAAIVRAG